MAPAIKQLPVERRPRERLLAAGAAALTDPELIALLFGGDLAAAERVVGHIGAAAELRLTTSALLREVPGVGPTRAAQLVAAIELGRRAAGGPERGQAIRCARQVHELLRGLADLEVEELHVVGLDARRRRVTDFASARGEANLVHVSPREVFRRALREGAASVIVVHNHPSGNPIPSSEDVALTERLFAAGEVVGVPLLDHVVIGAEGYFSFAERKLLWKET